MSGVCADRARLLRLMNSIIPKSYAYKTDMGSQRWQRLNTRYLMNQKR